MFVTVIRYSGLSGGSNRLAVTSRYLYFNLIYALKFRLMIARPFSKSADLSKPLLAVTHPDVTKRLAVTLNYPNTCPVSFQGVISHRLPFSGKEKSKKITSPYNE